LTTPPGFFFFSYVDRCRSNKRIRPLRWAPDHQLWNWRIVIFSFHGIWDTVPGRWRAFWNAVSSSKMNALSETWKEFTRHLNFKMAKENFIRNSAITVVK
jgi:hypothetical protein